MWRDYLPYPHMMAINSSIPIKSNGKPPTKESHMVKKYSPDWKTKKLFQTTIQMNIHVSLSMYHMVQNYAKMDKKGKRIDGNNKVNHLWSLTIKIIRKLKL